MAAVANDKDFFIYIKDRPTRGFQQQCGSASWCCLAAVNTGLEWSVLKVPIKKKTFLSCVSVNAKRLKLQALLCSTRTFNFVKRCQENPCRRIGLLIQHFHRICLQRGRKRNIKPPSRLHWSLADSFCSTDRKGEKSMCNDHSLNFSLLFIPLWVWTLTGRSLDLHTAVSPHGSLSPRWPSIQTANWPLRVPVICSSTFCYIRPNHSGGSESLRTVLFAFLPPAFRSRRGNSWGQTKKRTGGNGRLRLWLVFPHKHTEGRFDERSEKRTWFSGLLVFLVFKVAMNTGEMLSANALSISNSQLGNANRINQGLIRVFFLN